MQIGMKLYYELATGIVILNTGERTGDVSETTQEHDFETYVALSERIPSTVGMVQLEYGQHSPDFTECSGYRVNPNTGELEFSYPDPNQNPEEPTEPVYQQPLTEKVAALEQNNILLKAQNTALSERADFIEDIIAEMAMQVYQ